MAAVDTELSIPAWTNIEVVEDEPPNEQLTLQHEGDSSTVYLAQGADGCFMVKFFDRQRVRHDPSHLVVVLREKAMLEAVSKTQHPFIIHFLSAHISPTAVYLKMECAPQGDLFTWIMTHGALPPPWARIALGEVCLALQHLHALDIMYRDLSPENVVLTADSHVKLADFGWAKLQPGRIDDAPPPPVVHTLCGTPEYASPEVIQTLRSCETADFWSLGCLAAEVLTGSTPFYHTDARLLLHMICVAPVRLPEDHPHLGAAERDFLEALLQRDPAERLGARPGGASAVLAHRFFGGVSEAALLEKRAGCALPEQTGGGDPAPRPSEEDDGVLAEDPLAPGETVPLLATSAPAAPDEGLRRRRRAHLTPEEAAWKGAVGEDSDSETPPCVISHHGGECGSGSGGE